MRNREGRKGGGSENGDGKKVVRRLGGVRGSEFRGKEVAKGRSQKKTL